MESGSHPERGAGVDARMERASRRASGGSGLYGYLLVGALVAIALAIYFTAGHTASGGPLSSRGTGFVIGEATGIAAAVLLPVAVILASRVKPLEYLFGDLTSAYVAHGVIGLAMFAVVSFHPLMYLLGGLLIPDDFLTSAEVLIPFHVVALDWASYIAIATALVFTMYFRLSFSNWRLVHLLLGFAMVLTGYSILIDNRAFDTADIPALRWFLAAIYILGTISFLWVAIVRRVAEPKREYRITGARVHEAADAIELTAEPVGAACEFEPGQFVYVDLLDSKAQVHREFEAHPFSIASGPDRGTLSLVIETRGEDTRRMQRIAASDEARALLHSTYGRLVARLPSEKKQLWVAGGIGVTPFMAMADDMRMNPDRYEEYEVTLVVGVDHAEQAFEFERLAECAEACPGLEVVLWDRDVRGLPTAEGLADEVEGEITERAILLCGPDPMITALTEQFRELGVPRGQIHAERQIGPPDNWRQASPSLRRARNATTVVFVTFVAAVVVSTLGNVLFG